MKYFTPTPQQLELFGDKHTLASNTNLYCPDELLGIAEQLMLRIRSVYTAYSGKILNEPITESSVVDYEGIIFVTAATLQKEEYTLTIDSHRIVITASDYRGFFYGYVTLLQLFPDQEDSSVLSFQCLSIKDKPKYPWRGLLFDEARHFFGKDEVLRLLELLSYLKINKFHWHLSDDQGFRLELDCYKNLTDIGSKRNDSQVGGFYSNRFAGTGHQGYYTKADVLEIVQFAQSHAIEIIPEINLPSHCSALIASIPELQCSQEKIAVETRFSNISRGICPSNPNTIEVLKNIITEVCQLFPGKYIHLGGSDCCFEQWQNCPKCMDFMEYNGFTDLRQLLGYFLNEMADVARDLGKRSIIFSSGYSDLLSQDIILQYNGMSQLTQTVAAHSRGREIIVSPPPTSYFDYPNAITPVKKVYLAPLPPIEFDAETSHILGIEAVLWTEWIYDREKIDLNLFPRMIAVAEKSWGRSFGKDSYKDFVAKCGYLETLNSHSNVNFYRFYNEKISPFTRMKTRWQYLHNDQSGEVRRNRKN